ncbi:MAG: hypothetical protein WA117_19455 [Verrucomicrobiia bacterium]
MKSLQDFRRRTRAARAEVVFFVAADVSRRMGDDTSDAANGVWPGIVPLGTVR